jgi:hypothetical protein
MRELIAQTYGLRSVDPMERYATRRCHMGTNNDSIAISSPLAFGTMFLLKGEGMLGSYPNFSTLGFQGVS